MNLQLWLKFNSARDIYLYALMSLLFQWANRVQLFPFVLQQWQGSIQARKYHTTGNRHVFVKKHHISSEEWVRLLFTFSIYLMRCYCRLSRDLTTLMFFTHCLVSMMDDLIESSETRLFLNISISHPFFMPMQQSNRFLIDLTRIFYLKFISTYDLLLSNHPLWNVFFLLVIIRIWLNWKFSAFTVIVVHCLISQVRMEDDDDDDGLCNGCLWT